MRWARTSALRKPSEHEGRAPSSVCVHRRDKGSIPAHQIQSARRWYGVCSAARSAAQQHGRRATAEAARRPPTRHERRWSWSALTGAEGCAAVLLCDAGVCAYGANDITAPPSMRSLSHAPALDQAPAEGAVARISGWRRRRRNRSSEGRTGRCCEVYEAHLQAWRPRPAGAAAATATIGVHARPPENEGVTSHLSPGQERTVRRMYYNTTDVRHTHDLER